MLLLIENLTKVYRGGFRKEGTVANDGICFSVAAGEIVGLLGHNGAGKTTLVNQIAGIAKPTSGTVRLSGRDVVADPDFARQECAFMPQAQARFDGVTPRQAIEVIARIRGAGRAAARARADELIEALDIGHWAKTSGERLSGGVRRLTSFAMAAAVPGRLMILDEPTNDVDPVRRRRLWEQVRMLGMTGCGVLLVTHNVVEAERSVDRLVILDKGRVVAEGTSADLRMGSAGLRLEVTLSLGALAPDSPGWVESSPLRQGQRWTVSLAQESAAAALEWAQGLRKAGHIEEFSLTPTSLEDAYVRIVDAGIPAEVERLAPRGDQHV
ncbi:ABC transporter ATP-binding protein [Sphaerisporangium sp. B11E5]|uniref:ABC transporter ATP-binding protein n=1 Tax=Sphaerisporangium sp. B11E5 TaxID=3153563 RepID=UPI00325DE71E